MKKLLIYDHLGEKTLERDVFVEGSDFEHKFPVPTCYWLGKILIVDKEPEPELVLEPEPEIKIEPEPEPTPEPTPDYMQQKLKCRGCGWEGMRRECSFGHNDYYCPSCNKEALEEVKPDEPKAVSNKSAGVKRTRKAKQPKSPKRQTKKRA